MYSKQRWPFILLNSYKQKIFLLCIHNVYPDKKGFLKMFTLPAIVPTIVILCHCEKKEIDTKDKSTQLKCIFLYETVREATQKFWKLLLRKLLRRIIKSRFFYGQYFAEQSFLIKFWIKMIKLQLCDRIAVAIKKFSLWLCKLNWTELVVLLYMEQF